MMRLRPTSSVNEEADTFYERVGFQAKRQIVVKHL